jgi:hypothetical protein
MFSSLRQVSAHFSIVLGLGSVAWFDYFPCFRKASWFWSDEVAVLE